MSPSSASATVFAQRQEIHTVVFVQAHPHQNRQPCHLHHLLPLLLPQHHHLRSLLRQHLLSHARRHNLALIHAHLQHHALALQHQIHRQCLQLQLLASLLHNPHHSHQLSLHHSLARHHNPVHLLSRVHQHNHAHQHSLALIQQL